MKKAALVILTTSIAGMASAHSGHAPAQETAGAVSHYLLSPIHLGGVVIVLAALTAFSFRWTLKKQKVER